MLLLPGFGQNIILHGALAHQPIDVHAAGLPDAMRPILCLRVHGRVPVRVVEYDAVCTRQVDAEPTTASRQDDADAAAGVGRAMSSISMNCACGAPCWSEFPVGTVRALW